MAEPTLSDVMAALVAIKSELNTVKLQNTQQTALLSSLVTGDQLIMSNLDTLTAALSAVNAATSQEAALLAADTATLAQIQATQASNGPKLDAIQALITSLVNTAGVPQSVLDAAAAAQTAVNGLVASSTANGAALAAVQSSTTAQSSRLDQLGQDPRNPVPVPPPAP
jgi:hypothetical protein